MCPSLYYRLISLHFSVYDLMASSVEVEYCNQLKYSSHTVKLNLLWPSGDRNVKVPLQSQFYSIYVHVQYRKAHSKLMKTH